MRICKKLMCKTQKPIKQWHAAIYQLTVIETNLKNLAKIKINKINKYNHEGKGKTNNKKGKEQELLPKVIHAPKGTFIHIVMVSYRVIQGT